MQVPKKLILHRDRKAHPPVFIIRGREALFQRNSSVQRPFKSSVSSGSLKLFWKLSVLTSLPSLAPPARPLGEASTGRVGPLGSPVRSAASRGCSLAPNWGSLIPFQAALQSPGAFRKCGQGGVTFATWHPLCIFLLNADQLCTSVARTYAFHSERSHEL